MALCIVNSTHSCSSLYQSLLLQEVVCFLSFFTILVLQLLQPEQREQNRFEKVMHHFGFHTTAGKYLEQYFIWCALY